MVYACVTHTHTQKTQTHTHAHTHIGVRALLRIGGLLSSVPVLHTHMHTHKHKHTHTNTHVHAHTHAGASATLRNDGLLTLVHVFVTYAHAHTNTNTHTHMHVHTQVRVPFLEMMASLAVGEYGTSLVLRQFAEMARSPSLEVLTWRKLFTAMVEYCVRYNTVLAEVGLCKEGRAGRV